MSAEAKGRLALVAQLVVGSLLLVPALLAFGQVFWYPALRTLWLSLHVAILDRPAHLADLATYARALRDPRLGAAITHSGLVALARLWARQGRAGRLVTRLGLGLPLALSAPAALLLFMARLIPILRAAGAGVVVHLRERSRQLVPTDLWKVAVDVPLLVATAYGYWSLSRRGMRDIVNVDPLGDPFRDPLLLLAPSLFVFTASLIGAHLFPLLIRPLDVLSGLLGRFSVYMGLRQLARQGRQYSSALFLVIVCLSLGAFYASTALSLDRWLVDRIYYQVGADLRFSQGTGSGGGGPDGGGVMTGPGGWLLPPSDYLELPGVTAATRVGRFEVSPQLAGVRRMGQFLGLDRLDFSKVAFFRDDLAPVPLGELMNRLGMYEDGLLVSRPLMRATAGRGPAGRAGGARRLDHDQRRLSHRWQL